MLDAQEMNQGNMNNDNNQGNIGNQGNQGNQGNMNRNNKNFNNSNNNGGGGNGGGRNSNFGGNNQVSDNFNCFVYLRYATFFNHKYNERNYSRFVNLLLRQFF